MFNLFRKKKTLRATPDFSWAWERLRDVREFHGRREVMAAIAAAARVHGYDIEVVYRSCTDRRSEAKAEDFFVDEKYGLPTDREHINQLLRECIEDISPGFLEADLVFTEKRIPFSKLQTHTFHAGSSLVAAVDVLLQPEWDALVIADGTMKASSNPEIIAPPSRRL
jgi:hypothetical protein